MLISTVWSRPVIILIAIKDFVNPFAIILRLEFFLDGIIHFYTRYFVLDPI